jgi:hypothetical protein
VTTTWISRAARNNADWCAAMSRAHGITGDFSADAWTSPLRTPLFYPDAVTLTPNADPAALVARIDAGPGASVKDSFADLDLRPYGFDILFEAQWIHHPATTPATTAPWTLVEDPATLHTWATAWDNDNADLFRPELLDDPDVSVIAKTAPDGRIIAGAVLNQSEDAVGVSNVFAAEGDSPWPIALAAASGKPLVGYEHGEALAAALNHGFKPVGPLRVWLRG